jgi:hypothetical protein
VTRMSAAGLNRNWNTLTSLATLGTNRGAPKFDELWPTTALTAPSAAPPERKLLRAAALSYLWQLSGVRIPAVELPPAELAPSTNTKVVSENAAWRLARMLSGDHRDLVPEWLALAAQAGAVLPPHWLPVVLNELQPRERTAAAPVLGARGEWLAGRNPQWAELASASGLPIERWNNGTLVERRAALAAMRMSDPVGARILVERSWQTEPPDARVAFLETLLVTPGLSAGDEPFLEAALNDKRKDVRMAALECLYRLPGSAHARRNSERLQQLVILPDAGSGLLSKLRKRRLEIVLPESLDKTMARDGINAKPPAQQKIGERAYWLMQMIAIAPPSSWCERFQCDIETFITAALATDYAADLLSALSQAAIRHRDVAWIEALSIRWLKWHSHPEHLTRAAEMIPALVAAAPPTARDSILRQLLAASDAQQFDFLQPTLIATDVAWSAETTRRACELLDQCTEFNAPEHSQARYTIPRWGARVEVATASRALSRTLERAGDKSPWRNALDALSSIIEFRLAMRQELLT